MSVTLAPSLPAPRYLMVVKGGAGEVLRGAVRNFGGAQLAAD
jgi:hypothetical protein